MKEWQKILLRASGVGAGMAVVLVGIALAIYWYSSRPKTWDTKTISCVSADAGAFYEYNPATQEMKTTGFSLKFALANNASRDYTLPQNAKLFKRLASTQALEEFDGKFEHAFLIPARDRAQVTIRVDYSCSISDMDGGHVRERDQPTCFHDALGDVTEFVALDEDNKIQLRLPKPTLTVPKDQKEGGSKAERSLRPDRGAVFDRAAACQQAAEFVAMCKKKNVSPPPDSFAAAHGYADHLPDWTYPPTGYKLDATPQSCEVAMEWQNFCLRAK